MKQPQADQRLERGARIRHVRFALAVALGNVTAKRFGELVAAEEAREKAYDKATPTRWEDGSSPSIEAIEAMVRIAQEHGLKYVSRAWLAFGPAGVEEAVGAPLAPVIQPLVLDLPRAKGTRVRPKEVGEVAARHARQGARGQSKRK